MSKFIKVQYNLPEALVQRLRRETARRSKIAGISYGMQTSVVRQAIQIGLLKLEAEKRR